jgi:hypothetical protein
MNIENYMSTFTDCFNENISSYNTELSSITLTDIAFNESIKQSMSISDIMRETGSTESSFVKVNIPYNEIHDLFIQLVETQKNKEYQKNIWKNSPYKDIVKLQSNNAGIVGELLIQHICSMGGIPSNIDGSKTKQIGGGKGDGYIKNKSVEIKIAHQGACSNSFQHELGEIPWIVDYMIFIDISPHCIYLTIFKNFCEETYKNGNKCVPYFPTKSITWRKHKGAFKLDTSVSLNEKNIENGYTCKINNVDISFVYNFIDKNIV